MLFFLGKRRRSIAADVRARLGESEIVLMDESALSLGVESAGVWQVRGNGCLAATNDEILFIMWLPRKELSIPRERVTSIERARAHLGKTIGHELLRVRFVNESGRPDSVAWYVRDLSTWEATLGG